MRRIVGVLTLMLLTALLTSRPGEAASTSGPRVALPDVQVLLVGIPGLRWDQLSASGTPALWAFAADSARGALSVRSETERTCPDAGWLTLGAGNRATALAADCGTRATFQDWPRLLAANSDALDSRQIGALGDALTAVGSCAHADGHAALAIDGGTFDLVCPLELVELPAVRDAASAAAADSALSQLLRRTPPAATVVVAGISETRRSDHPHLHVLAIRGESFPAGAELSSPSTSRAPYVQLIDLAPTVLAVLGRKVPPSMSGRPITVHARHSSSAGDIRRLADLDTRAAGQRAAVVPFTVLLVAALLALVGCRWRGRRRGLVEAAAVVMAMPAASFLMQLVPWWRAGELRVAALLGGCLVIAGAIAALAMKVTRRHDAWLALGAIAAVTAVIIACDLVTGTRLQMDAVLGYSPYVAGRFVGLGNPGFAVFGTAAVLATALLVPRRAGAWRWVTLFGAVAVVVDGAPPWGDDFGGVLALVPAFVVVASLQSTGRVRWSRLVVSGLGAAALVTAFALADYGRGAGHRTHLGRFVEQVRDGTAGEVIHRKAQANLDLLTHSPFTLLVPVLMATAVWLLLRPPAAVERRLAAAPNARAALDGVLALSIVGGLVNDSGTAIPAVGLLLAVPVALVLGVSGRTPEPAG
ncbi:MAG: hypothetical protein QOE64_747 [Frankiales bacterium]|nr:hypothetical protein [Frankiales bacterium]